MYKKSSTGWLKHLDFMILDIICLQLAFIMGFFLRHHSLNPYGNTIYRNEAIVFALIQVMIMFFDDSFKNVMKRGYLAEIGKTVKNMIYIIVLGVFYLFLIREEISFSRVNHYFNWCHLWKHFLSDACRLENVPEKTRQRRTQRPFPFDYYNRKTVTVCCKKHA